jgi:hypothetical protein
MRYLTKLRAYYCVESKQQATETDVSAKYKNILMWL